MIFERTPLDGPMIVRADKKEDARGFFARLWCESEFAAAGCPFVPTQISTSYNFRCHTLRGMHWQSSPHEEVKLVRATSGRVYDVIVDLREDSPTRLRWFGVELDAADHTALLIPRGFAHGFLTLTAQAELLYLIDVPYAPRFSHGARYDDPAIGIDWPAPPAVISERDAGFENLNI